MSTLDRTRRRTWARRMIRAATFPIPRYGSEDWHALPETDRSRVAAVVLAAECWAEDCDELAPRLATEVATGRAEQQQAEADEFAAMAANVRKLASAPSYATVADRRGERDRADRSRAHARAMRASSTLGDAS